MASESSQYQIKSPNNSSEIILFLSFKIQCINASFITGHNIKATKEAFKVVAQAPVEIPRAGSAQQ